MKQKLIQLGMRPLREDTRERPRFFGEGPYSDDTWHLYHKEDTTERHRLPTKFHMATHGIFTIEKLLGTAIYSRQIGSHGDT